MNLRLPLMKMMISVDGDTSWCFGRATDLGDMFRLTSAKGKQKEFSRLEQQLKDAQMILSAWKIWSRQRGFYQDALWSLQHFPHRPASLSHLFWLHTHLKTATTCRKCIKVQQWKPEYHLMCSSASWSLQYDIIPQRPLQSSCVFPPSRLDIQLAH